MAILNFSDETVRRFLKLLDVTIQYHRTWKFAIRILKISQLVLVLLTKNRFSAAILNFYDQTGSRNFEPIYFTNHYHRSWQFAIKILKISQLLLKLSAKNRFLAAILNFYDRTGSRIFETIFFTNFCYRTWKSAIRILKISLLVLELWGNNIRTDRQTDIHTDRHTYIHTDRQTELKYYIRFLNVNIPFL